MKYDNLKEAFEETLKKAEGYQNDMRIPIFKNEDGTFETGSIQQKSWSDISDGTFEEIASVDGWIFEDDDNGIPKEDQLENLLSDYSWIEEQYQFFLEKYELS